MPDDTTTDTTVLVGYGAGRYGKALYSHDNTDAPDLGPVVWQVAEPIVSIWTPVPDNT